jgi:peptide deformylase
MNDEYGCGIAAPQIGESTRLIITSRWKKNKNKLTQNGKPFIMINPVITKASNTMISDEE